METCLAENKDNVGHALEFKYSIIISYTSLAQIYRTLSRFPLVTPDYAVGYLESCNDALGRVMSILGELKAEDFRLLDPFLGVSLQFTLSCSMLMTLHPQPCWFSVLLFFDDSLPRFYYEPTNNLPPRELSCSKHTNYEILTRISRLAELTDQYVRGRLLLGTTTLCADLAAISESDSGPATNAYSSC